MTKVFVHQMQVMSSFVAVNLTSERYGGNIFSRKGCIKANCLDIFPLVARLSITVHYKVIDDVVAIETSHLFVYRWLRYVRTDF